MPHAAAAHPVNANFVHDSRAAVAADRPTAAPLRTALDALASDNPNASSTAAEYLTTLANTFDDFALQAPGNGLLDCKVLGAIERFLPYLGEYRAFVGALAQRSDAQVFASVLVSFFASLQRYKQPLPGAAQESVLWADGYRFILRELFLTTTAILLRHERYDAAAALLEARYGDGDDDGSRASFVVFDGYAKTLDEFRNRRLQLHRLSVSSDLLRDRADATQCSFADIMQADFVLCLRSLICKENFFVRWFPRSLVYAERFANTGFDLFVSAAGPGRFAPLARLFKVVDRDDLTRSFEDVADAWCLAGWELGGCPLDFHGYMGLRNAALTR